VFSTARSAAVRTACMSNTKQLAASMTLYLQDSDDTYPPSIYPATPPKVLTFYDALSPYLKDVDLFRCPADSSPTVWSDFLSSCQFPFQSAGNFDRFSYDGNYCLFRPGTDNPLPPPPFRFAVRKFSEIPRPSDEPVLFDGTLDCSFASFVAPRHGSGVNASYAEGHAKYVACRKDAAGNWLVSGGPFDGRMTLWGMVDENGNYGGCPN